jgi:DNA-binding response OmpR family regulator
MTSPCILVVDDDPDILSLLDEVFTGAGWKVAKADNGRAALRTLYELRPDVVALDVAMPELDGWETLERIREVSDVPVLMLTARATDADKVRGLRAGADDYVTKPFGLDEVVARAEALARRARVPAEAARDVYDDGRVRVDFRARSVEVEGREVSLTPLEFKLLSALVRHSGEALEHDRLHRLVWGDETTVSRDQVRLYVAYLRRKLEEAGDVPIETVRGVGYRYRRP